MDGEKVNAGREEIDSEKRDFLSKIVWISAILGATIPLEFLYNSIRDVVADKVRSRVPEMHTIHLEVDEGIASLLGSNYVSGSSKSNVMQEIADITKNVESFYDHRLSSKPKLPWGSKGIVQLYFREKPSTDLMQKIANIDKVENVEYLAPIF